MTDLFLKSDATFSACRAYRYLLWRIWEPRRPLALFVMLNPSIAGRAGNDPTSRRCIAYATAWGCGGVLQANLYALRSAAPQVLALHPDPVGPDNDAVLGEAARRTRDGGGRVLAAWGADPAVAAREAEVLKILAAGGRLDCLRQTMAGHPAHPLYLPAGLAPRPFAWRAVA